MAAAMTGPQVVVVHGGNEEYMEGARLLPERKAWLFERVRGGGLEVEGLLARGRFGCERGG